MDWTVKNLRCLPSQPYDSLCLHETHSSCVLLARLQVLVSLETLLTCFFSHNMLSNSEKRCNRPSYDQ